MRRFEEVLQEVKDLKFEVYCLRDEIDRLLAELEELKGA